VVYGLAASLLFRAGNARKLATVAVDEKSKANLLRYADALEAEVKDLLSPPSSKSPRDNR
jgi:hypothetical protein